jgi:CRP/FNR family transcriptional regulator, nitrogen oxide reductase regulator
MAAPAIVPFRNLRPRFLDGLAAAEVKTIVSAARRRRYLANSVIANQGHPADHFFLLLAGRARYFHITPDGRKAILHWLPPGEIFGGAALLPAPSEYLVSTEAVKDSSVLVWERATVRGLIARYPRMTDNMLLIMFDYLVFYRGAHISLTCDTAGQRLARVLANLASGIGERVADGIELDVRNEELANEANVTPFTASRLLSGWQRKGILTKKRGKVLLRFPERLFLEEV